jgi:trigger factor
MNVTETSADGLKREYKVVVPQADIDAKVNSKLAEIARQVRLPGFRPGKVPMSILKQRYGKSVLGEVLETAVNETSQQTMSDRGLRPAFQPKIEVTSFEDDSDLEYTMSLEVLPDVEVPDLSGIELERPVAPVREEDVEDMLRRLAENRKRFEPVAEPRPAAEGDQVLIDFKGSVDGEERPGMAADDFELALGSGQFIPGFEDQLTGASPGEHRQVTVTFPDAYGEESLAGKEAVFEVDVKEVRAPKPTEIDDELAKAYGEESLESLRARLREGLAEEYRTMSRARLKRQLLDKLAERVRFPVPDGLVDSEFDNIWHQIEHAREHGHDDPDLQKPEEELRAEYRGIAERRVRLGLLLAEIGRQNNVEIGKDELNAAIAREMRKYPGQEDQFVEFLKNQPGAIESIRAPLLEEKVVDFILEMASVSEREVSLEELRAEPDEAAAPQAEGSSGDTRSADGGESEASSGDTAAGGGDDERTA